MTRSWYVLLVACCAALTTQASFANTVTINENRVDIVGPPGNTVTFDTANAVTSGTSSQLPNTGFATGSGGTTFRNTHNTPLGFDLTPTMFVITIQVMRPEPVSIAAHHRFRIIASVATQA